MNTLTLYISLLVVFLGTINLFRMTVFLLGSDIYSLRFHKKKQKNKTFNLHSISVVVPAFNEEKSIIRCINSIFANNFPQNKLEVIVVDDGSEDKTNALVIEYKKVHKLDNLHIIHQPNSGKAHALNKVIKDIITGELVMCLDADSYLERNALINTSRHFLEDNIVAVASNVKIHKTRRLLNLIQQFEYIICYQMKRAQTVFNIEYIIGGIGSTFRRDHLQKINYYDANTVTEDIDITMKILKHGHKDLRVIYGADVICYTQSVLTINDLIKQRFRWKWGRSQTFLKNKSLFFSRDKKYHKGLTWFYLPYALFNDVAFLTEPIMVGFLIYLVAYYKDATPLISALTVISFYSSMNVLAEDTITYKDKISLILLAPIMYILFYILSFVEYIALLKSIFRIHTLKQSLSNNKNNWRPVKRLGTELLIK